MKKTTILAILGLLVFNLSFGQDREKYSELIKEAWNLYQTKGYKQSAEKYSQAFSVLGDKSNTSDRYNAACSWALAKEIDSSFAQLIQIAKKGNYSNYRHITTDSDLDNLHLDKRWSEVLKLVKSNKVKKEANFDKPLVAILDTVLQQDQGLRKQINEVEKKYGRDSKEMRDHWKKIAQKDSINLIKIQKILDERGWLGPDIIGNQGNSTLFLVIQHSDLSIQEKYLPMMRDAVSKGNARANSLALLEDRVALSQGNSQIYGSQIYSDKDGKRYVAPLIDPENVDKRRAEVGLGTLQDYVSRWNIVWDVEKYKKELPELIANLKK
ncbi:DUF6624 domain-containing protein [Algibacter sp. R77976]|uniref:DUF6624 domain-containing protein n=1 Tax=Algibacter sp. R77976 TaxID=3093873 RepID=UPI0037CCA7CA